jgi:DNA invertase Pin-like site-specific DNA recombinase
MAAFAGYIRVSQVGGRSGPSFISPDVQEQTIRQLAKAHSLELSGIVQELDVSGGRPVDDRKLGELVRSVEAGDSGGIVVWKLSRFSRDLLDGVTVADRIIRAGGRLLAEDFDSNQGMSKAILGFLLGWAEEERDSRRSGWRAAQERAVARGIHLAPTPVGYLRTDEGTLVPGPDADLVRKAFQGRAKGASIRDCADLLGTSKSGTRSLFKSRTYRGPCPDGRYRQRECAPAACLRAPLAAGTAGARSTGQGRVDCEPGSLGGSRPVRCLRLHLFGHGWRQG